MEDISRELEREIALSKPKPYKQDRKAKVLIVDDFGQVKSGEYLKKLVILLSILSSVFFIAAGIFYILYSEISRDTSSNNNKLAIAEKKVDELTREKEVLMARLVIKGKEPGISKSEIKVKDDKRIAQVEEKKPLVTKPLKITSIPVESDHRDNKTKDLAVVQSQQGVKPELSVLDNLPVTLTKPQSIKAIKKTISIEKFTVLKGRANGDLLVRFDIRNISNTLGEVSGRIFTVLKPDNDIENQWLVVPKAPLQNGIPSEYKKGQYFSITHFKPVKFRIKNQANPDFFKKASIFIFNEQADLIFEELIDITEAK